MKFKYVSGPTSSAKTALIVGQTAKRYLKNGKSLIAVPSIDVCDEIGARINQQYPGLPVEIYHSKSERGEGSGSVKIDVQRSLLDSRRGEGRIVIICHATLCNLDARIDLSEWHCFIDEMLDVYHPVEINLQDSHQYLTDHLRVVPADEYYSKITSGNDTSIRAIAENRNKDAFRHLIEKVAERTLNPHYDCYTNTRSYEDLINRRGKRQKLYHISVLHPRVVSSFGGVTLFAARVEETLQYHVWKQEGVDWERDAELTAQLRFTEHRGYEKTKISWGFARNFSKSSRDKHPDAYEGFIASGLGVLGGSNFIRLENNDIKGISTLSRCDNGETIPGRPHGLNKYRYIDHAFVVPATNYSPFASKFLSQRYGFTYEQQLISFAGHNIYQAISRTSMRDGDMERERIWIVPSRHHAEWLSRIFQGASCISLALDQPSAGNRGRVGVYESDKQRKNQSKQIARNKERQRKDFIDEIGVDMMKGVVLFHDSDVDDNTLYVIDQFVDTYRSSWFDHKKQKHAQVILMKEHGYLNWLKRQSKIPYAKKDDVPLVSPAFYNPLSSGETKRGKVNVVLASGIMIDFDDTHLQPGALIEILGGIQCVTYSTYSNKMGNLRYRLYIPTTRPMLISEYTAIVDGIIKTIEEAGYHGKDQSPAKPNGSASESEGDRCTIPSTIEGTVKRHGIDTGKRGPYSLFHLPCRSPTGHGFFNDHSGPGRAPLDVNAWLSVLPAIEEPQPRQVPLNYNYADEAHTLTQKQRDGIEEAMMEWFRTGTLPKNGNDAMWELYKCLKDLRLPLALMEEQLRVAADTANTPKDHHEQVDYLLNDEREYRLRMLATRAA